ncbi:zinc finger and BTB domain-containing protein 38 isoform 1-T3 [Pholidichthys leucotaenia]
MTVVSPCTQSLMDSTHPSTVLSKLNEQRSQGLFCDVTIVVEDVKFRAHKNILAACSGYFRNALTTSETWSSSQVLELMDLKSEVFACILNFIYSSKVISSGVEDTRGLIAAGKRLGIPFLERLVEQDRQDECVKFTAAAIKKKAAPGPEEIDGARGPRITNAFSMTEVCPGNNPFTPLVQSNGERQSPDAGQLPLSSTTSSFSGNNETTHALSEHSYAVCKSTEGKDCSQWDVKKFLKPAPLQPKPLIYRNVGPLKKRHKLTGILGRNTVPTPAEPQANEPNTKTPIFTNPLPDVVMTPPALFSEEEREKSTDTGLPLATENAQMELGPPTLSPHTEDSISIYSCEHCPEIFTNKALLNIHSEVHKKRFVSHLFCKFCHRKFIHLKRLRNHEQVCTKSVKGPPNLDDKSTSDEQADHNSDGMLDMMTQLPSSDSSDPYTPEPPQVEPLEPPQDEKPVRPSCSQRRYNCSVCKRVYVTLSSLKRHENVHSWQRAYPCHYCNKVFALAEYRTKHEIWHTGERRYQCIFCLETFMTYYILKNHLKSFHGIDPSLAVKKKSANGGLKASIYPIKLYRLLPMKFRKRQYRTYSKTYSEGIESIERGDHFSLNSNSLVPPFEENGLISHPDTSSFPLTFMATTKMVSPVMPRISFDKPSDRDIDQNELDVLGGTRKEAQDRDPTLNNQDSNFIVEPSAESSAGYTDGPPVLLNSEHVSHNVSLLNSLNTVKKLGELSASAKRVENMTKEILQSSTDNLVLRKQVGEKTETYIAKPACPGPSVESDTMPLCQITVKIGNEAIICRQIKGSKLFPKKKRRIRELSGEESPPTRENPESPRLRHRSEHNTGTEKFDDPTDCDASDKLWRPYYSYKAKKKQKKLRYKLRYKHRKALLCPYQEMERKPDSEAPLERRSWLEEESSSSGSTGVKHSLSRNCSPRATYNCNICDSSFITETGLRAHVIGSHPYFCRTCRKQGPPGEAPTSGDYICKSCMENGSCFDNTPRSPNPGKRYRCSYCPQRFLYLATKKSHEKKHQEANEEAYDYDNFIPSSKNAEHLSDDNKQAAIKTEDGDNQESPNIKCEKLEGEHFSINKNDPKTEDRTDFVPLDSDHDSNIKSPLSPLSGSLFSLTPSKGKHKMEKKKVHAKHSFQLNSKNQVHDRECDSNMDSSTGPRTNRHNICEQSCKLFRRSDSETKDAHISLHKTEKWVCKDEPVS